MMLSWSFGLAWCFAEHPGASWSVAARVWHPGRVESSCRACWRVHRQRHNPCTRIVS
ncbi:unnamed protein product [Durusdinium trenchii]|uniref:Secreted protein n=1 Tax=Durusdinium trenchii TaxID=1381693 RepID=A0ABP0NH55_9DINO